MKYKLNLMGIYYALGAETEFKRYCVCYAYGPGKYFKHFWFMRDALAYFNSKIQEYDIYYVKLYDCFFREIVPKPRLGRHKIIAEFKKKSN